jgi:hypothetical protein
MTASCSQVFLQPCQSCEGLGVGCEGGCTYECKGGQGLMSVPMWQLISDTCEEGNMDDAVNKDCVCADFPCGPIGRQRQCTQVGRIITASCGNYYCL